MMISKVGQIVTGVVVELHPYGAYLESGSQRIVVFVHQLSWTQVVRHPRDFTRVGERHPVMLLSWNDVDEVFVGSIKMAVERDPWERAVGEFGVGKMFTVRVMRHIHDYADPAAPVCGYSAEAAPGIDVYVPRFSSQLIDVGTELSVQVVSLDHEKKSIHAVQQDRHP